MEDCLKKFILMLPAMLLISGCSNESNYKEFNIDDARCKKAEETDTNPENLQPRRKDQTNWFEETMSNKIHDLRGTKTDRNRPR